MKQIKDYSRLLNFLYNDEKIFVEEIAVIENMYRYPDIKAYVDRYETIGSFMISQYNEDLTWSVFLHSPSNAVFVNSACKILPRIHKLHIQTGAKEKSVITSRIFCRHKYDYSMMSMEKCSFKAFLHPESTSGAFELVRLMPDSDIQGIDEWFGYGTPRLREEIRNGVYYGVKDGGQWAAIAGTQLKSFNCSYIFVSTEPPYRGKGYAKAALSAVCNKILEMGKTPVYALDASNIPSVRLAKSIGFSEYAHRECVFAGPWELMRPVDDNPGLPDSNYFE